MDELRIHTQIHSRYQVFDASGQLPFSIVFGLCRRSPTDTDPRPLLLDIAGSVLDVPYALAHGLLTLHEQDQDGTKECNEVDVSRLDTVAVRKTEWLSLQSPVDRKQHWRDSFATYQCQVDVDGPLSSILKPGKKYVVRLTSEDLGVKRWAYGDQERALEEAISEGKPPHASETAKLVNSKPTAGNATFTVVESLPWPPRITTRMKLCASASSLGASPAITATSSATALEVSITNTGNDTVTLQTRGHQRFLIPWGPFQPEADALDDRMRIIDATPHKPPTSGLQVVDFATGKVVRGNDPRGTGPLTDSHADRRPKVDEMVVLKPGLPIVRQVQIAALVEGLDDGEYIIRMQSRGCWWCPGEIGEEGVEDGRVPDHLYRTNIPPLMLESLDEVHLGVKDGRILATG